MRKTFTVLVVLSFVLMASISSATTYYVSELFGNDANDGLSEAAPFATIQMAADLMVAGDNVIIDFGEYRETIVPKNNGTIDNPIVYEAKDDVTVFGDDTGYIPTFTLHAGNVYVMDDVFRSISKLSEDAAPLTSKATLADLDTISGYYHDRAAEKLYVRSSDDADPAAHADTLFYQPYCFDIVEGSYITIDGFNFMQRVQAIVADNTVPLPGLVIQNNVFTAYAAGAYGLILNGGEADSANTYENILVKSNIFNNTAEFSFSRPLRFQHAGRNSVISDNTFNGHPALAKINSPCVRIEGSNDYFVAQINNLVIERNLLYKTKMRGISLRIGKMTDITIRNNIFYKTQHRNIYKQAGSIINLNLINNTEIEGSGAAWRIEDYDGFESIGKIYNNAFVNPLTDEYVLFFETKSGDKAVINYDIDYNFWTIWETCEDYGKPEHKMIRSRMPGASRLNGGPNAVYGHPMVALDSAITAINVKGDTITFSSIPDTLNPYPVFADTSDAPVGLTPITNSPLIDAGLASVAPADDYFGNLRADGKPDLGAIELDGVSDVAGIIVFPEEYSLSQNYPNPFNPSTTIEYSLPAAERINIAVYNIMGQKIATLYNGIQKFGTYKVTWNGTDDNGNSIPSGLYFYRLKAGSVTKTAKMMFLK